VAFLKDLFDVMFGEIGRVAEFLNKNSETVNAIPFANWGDRGVRDRVSEVFEPIRGEEVGVPTTPNNFTV